MRYINGFLLSKGPAAQPKGLVRFLNQGHESIAVKLHPVRRDVMPHDEVKDARLIGNRQIVRGTSATSHVHGVSPIVICSGDIRTHMCDVIEHEAILIVYRELPEGAVIRVLKSRRVATLCGVIRRALINIIGQLSPTPADSGPHGVLLNIKHAA
jgi:hypothetical protein